jgi:hypothetical protein
MIMKLKNQRPRLKGAVEPEKKMVAHLLLALQLAFWLSQHVNKN